MTADPSRPVRLLLAGDVMTGRGIDQILPHPCSPELYERYVTSAEDYVTLAERHSGPIPRKVTFDYVWGDLLGDLEMRRPDLRIINLETAITTEGVPEPKGINYRMNPANVGVLKAAGVDLCVLANNHVLDWGEVGLRETLATLQGAGIASVGAGRTATEAAVPSCHAVSGGRVCVLAFGAPSSGIPTNWRARSDRAGVNLLPIDIGRAVAELRHRVPSAGTPGIITIVSIHWGGNWGFDIPAFQHDLAHAMIEEAGADVIFGHSSHHPKGIALHRGKLVLFSCGDFINDYEGIGGYEQYRGDLGLACLLDVSPADGRLVALEMIPYRRRRFRLERAEPEAVDWLAEAVSRRTRSLQLSRTAEGTMRLLP